MIDTSQFVKLLPYSLTHDEVVVAMFEAAAIQLREAYDEALIVFDLVNIDGLPEELLDLIAFEKHVDFYDNELSLQQKRELIKKSISWHRKKGTRWAVEEILSIIFKDVDLYEWFEYGGDPYRFIVEVSVKENSSEYYRKMIEMIQSAKNARSKLEAFAWILGVVKYSLIDDTYHYPVFYLYQPTGEKMFSLINSENIEVIDDTYNYIIDYPVSEKKSGVILGENTVVKHDTYDYLKEFQETGVMETLYKQVSLHADKTLTKFEQYEYPVRFEVTEKQSYVIKGESIKNSEDIYTYPKRFIEAGNLLPLDKTVSTQVSSTFTGQETYDYKKTYAICGEFVAGGEIW